MPVILTIANQKGGVTVGNAALSNPVNPVNPNNPTNLAGYSTGCTLM